MKAIRKLIKYAFDSDFRFDINASHGFYRNMPDLIYLKHLFKARMGYDMDFSHPTTFNEKLQWLKLYDRNPLYIKLVDKYQVKDIVSGIIGSQYIIPTLGVWDRFDEIDFDSLPNQFVLKCTHDSGGLVICRDKSKLDFASARQKINKSMNRNYYYIAREWPYKDVKHRIIAEQYFENKCTEGNAAPVLNDYKLHCFNGRFDCVFVCEGRFSPRGVRYHYFDDKWTYLPYCPYEGLDTESLSALRPERFDEMICIAEKLSKGIPEVRVDLYEVNGQVYFGELTFFSQMGFDTSITREADEILGSKFELPAVKEA